MNWFYATLFSIFLSCSPSLSSCSLMLTPTLSLSLSLPWSHLITVLYYSSWSSSPSLSLTLYSLADMCKSVKTVILLKLNFKADAGKLAVLCSHTLLYIWLLFWYICGTKCLWVFLKTFCEGMSKRLLISLSPLLRTKCLHSAKRTDLCWVCHLPSFHWYTTQNQHNCYICAGTSY